MPQQANNNNGMGENIIAQAVIKAIEETCQKGSINEYIAASEASSYLKIASFFSRICPFVNAVLVGTITATFMYYASPHLPVWASIIGFILSVIVGENIPHLVYAVMATPHRMNFDQITGRDLKAIIANYDKQQPGTSADGKQDNEQ